MNNTTNYTIAT